jgi:hypothetical protein
MKLSCLSIIDGCIFSLLIQGVKVIHHTAFGAVPLDFCSGMLLVEGHEQLLQRLNSQCCRLIYYEIVRRGVAISTTI